MLLVHSFGSVTPPFTTHSTAFEAELVQKMGHRVDLDEVSLDMARYADPHLQEALVEYLQKRQSQWQPDLVVPIGAPAGVFVARYRERLFPNAPVLYCGMDRRPLPPDALEKNAAFVGENFDFRGYVEDILQIAPETRNIAMVIGASPIEQYWAQTLRETFKPFAGRVNFIWLDKLSFDQMLDRTSKLPPHSWIFLVLLLRDANGASYNGDEALQRMHAVANAPINSIFLHQFGLGIVGGHLYQAEKEGVEAARLAVRILDGEPASSFAPKFIGPIAPQYDWRELQRWRINEQLLPPGSRILFRRPTAWEEYHDWAVAGASIFVLQALLIAGLLANLIRRRRAERSLTESEQRFHAVADAAPVPMWMTGPDKVCTFFNKTWLDFTGKSLEQEIQHRWIERAHPDDAGKCRQTFDTAFDRREAFVMQYRLRRYDGEYRTVTDSGVPRYDVRDNFLGYIGACVDITDLLRQQEALHEIEERIALATEAAQLGVWELDTATNRVWTSEKICELFHFSPDQEVTYVDFLGRVHPEDQAELNRSIDAAIATSGDYESVFRILLPDGNIRWLGGRARCISYGDGSSKRLVGFSMDVTKHKEAEDLFRLATEASPSGTVLVDSEGHILLVNSHIEELFGYLRDELIGQPVDILMPERFSSRHPGHRASFLAAPEAAQELFAQRKDGSEFPVEIDLNSITTDHGILILATVVDISDRLAAEEEARHRRQQIDLLSRASLLGEMTASLAHELGQPLSAIVNNASAALQYIERGNLQPGQVSDILTDIVSDAGRAHEIIRNVRSAIKKGDVIRGRINLNDVVKSVSHMVLPDAAAHFCKLDLSLAENLPAIEGDPTQIQQVLINLVHNAFDAMRDTPSPRRTVQIATSASGDGKVCVAVRDYGNGISRGTRERLFEQFFTTKEEGLGMGLAIVRSIVETHGGQIAAENAAGGGARFFFHLPASNEVEK